jgi:hypothetical protein
VLKDKNILLISPESWDHIHVSKHLYAIHLGRRGNRVYFLNPPGKVWRTVDTQFSNVVSVHYSGFPMGLRFYPRTLQRFFIRRSYYDLEALCKCRFNIVWSFDNSVFYDFSSLPGDVLGISHIVDSVQDFQFQKAASTATLCIGVTKSIVERMRRHNPKSFFIHHGYYVRPNSVSIELPGNHPIRVGYAGNLNLKYIDWNLLDTVTASHCEVGFYFVGPYEENQEAIRRLKGRSNTYFMGQFPSEYLDGFYSQMDVLLLCYLADDYPDQLANPHKMMEYLGSGKVIVATATREYAELASRRLLVMSSNNWEFSDKFSRVLQDLETWNALDLQELRRQWAFDNSYDRQLDRIEEIIESID